MGIETIPKLCGSVAGKPSPLGVKLHNAGYKALKIDYKYLAMGTDELEPIIKIVRSLKFRGLGVSMPFKQKILSFLDEISQEVKTIGACNTVVNNEGKLIGYNTDWQGAINALKEVEGLDSDNAVIVGSGGVARAIAYGLKENGYKVFISARSEEKRKSLVIDLKLDGEDSLENQGIFKAPLVINATPLSENINCPIDLTLHSKGNVLLDVVFYPKRTEIIENAEKLGWKIVPGWRMLLHQALRQFKLYTNKDPPVEDMDRVLSDGLS